MLDQVQNLCFQCHSLRACFSLLSIKAKHPLLAPGRATCHKMCTKARARLSLLVALISSVSLMANHVEIFLLGAWYSQWIYALPLYLYWFLRRTRPLLIVLGLFMLFAASRQVGVVCQTAEQRGDHGTRIHLLLQETHTETVTPDLETHWCRLWPWT